MGKVDKQMLSIYPQLSRTSGIHKSPLFCLILKPPTFIYPTLYEICPTLPPHYCPNITREFSDTPSPPGTSIVSIIGSQGHLIQGPDTATMLDSASPRILSVITFHNTAQFHPVIFQHLQGAACSFPKLLTPCDAPGSTISPHTHSACHTTLPARSSPPHHHSHHHFWQHAVFPVLVLP